MSTQAPTSPVVKHPAAHRAAQPRLVAPLLLILAVLSSWALVLNNGIFIDESVYIRSGRAIIEHWRNGTPLASWVGEGFSGHPMVYPVLAGALDMVGGLALVRLFSLACIIATTLLLRSITASIFGRRAGLVTAAIFAFTGPVAYIAHLGTFDAMVTTLLAAAWWLSMRNGWRMVPVLALVLALAVVTKYTAYVFVPSLLVLSCFDRYALTRSARFTDWVHPHPPWSRIARAAVTGVLVAGLLALVYRYTGEIARQGLEFTTTGRKALSPLPRGTLISMVPDYAWPTFFAAALGVVFLVRAQRWTAVAWAGVLIGTSLLLPVAQVKLGEGVSFQKHLAYSALFLAPLAGWGFARPWKLAIWTPVLVWWLVLMSFWGGFRSDDLVQYPDVRPVVEASHFDKGTYLSSSADSLSYYTRDDPDVTWATTFVLYAQGPQEIRRAIHEDRYQGVIIYAGPTGSAIQDQGQQRLLSALRDNSYDVKKVGKDKEWLIYTPPQT